MIAKVSSNGARPRCVLEVFGSNSTKVGAVDMSPVMVEFEQSAGGLVEMRAG